MNSTDEAQQQSRDHSAEVLAEDSVEHLAKPSNKGTIPVLEIFGPTIQGEGMSIGRKTMFVRTAGCDYRCTWCDSAFTWDGSGKDEIRLLHPSDIWEELYRLGGSSFDHVTISGGNPAMLRQLGGLVRLLREKNIRTAVETQGSIWQDWMLEVDEVTVSPKPPSSGMNTDMTLLDDWVKQLSTRTAADWTPVFSLKVIVFDAKDLDYAGLIHRRYPLVPMFIQTGNPVTSGEAAPDVASRLLLAYEQLIEQVMERADMTNVRVLPQLHTLVWGNKRGV
ncbi:MAG: 7-carboxy-7-deazaguanine synthase QueE [Gorillibacterium sp.]|nr:7-carboxy-7-deazaguanine synthase QueE [Gorillibacterium sp.]